MAGGTETKVRPMIAAKERGPGPGRYSLPSTVGTSSHDPTMKKSPGFSFGTKLPNSILKKSDGPGPKDNVPASMTRTGKQTAPAFSMGTRPSGFKLAQTPAPGAYSPEKVKVDKGRTPPAYTMRPRYNDSKTDQTPASNTYALKGAIGEGPKVSITARSAIGGFAHDTAKAPGPGKYNPTDPDKYKKKSPGYSIAARTYPPEDQTKKPGPGAHNPDYRTKSSPAFSMGVRHTEYLTPLIVDVPDV